jgi:hypothetical protein
MGSILQIIIVFLGGLIMGSMIQKLVTKYSENLAKNRMIDMITKQFKQILSNIARGKSEFKNRVNNTVFLSSSLEDHGDVDIVYMMDSKEIAIFKESKCIYTSSTIKDTVLEDIVFTIEKRYKTQINDVVEVLGFKFYRPDFEKTFNVTPDQLKGEVSDIDKIQDENKKRFDIDEILDKIGKQGMSSLSDEEKSFLDGYSKNG